MIYLIIFDRKKENYKYLYIGFERYLTKGIWYVNKMEFEQFQGF